MPFPGEGVGGGGTFEMGSEISATGFDDDIVLLPQSLRCRPTSVNVGRPASRKPPPTARPLHFFKRSGHLIQFAPHYKEPDFVFRPLLLSEERSCAFEHKRRDLLNGERG